MATGRDAEVINRSVTGIAATAASLQSSRRAVKRNCCAAKTVLSSPSENCWEETEPQFMGKIITEVLKFNLMALRRGNDGVTCKVVQQFRLKAS